MSLLEVADLDVAYTRGNTRMPALRDINLTMERGAIVGLVGESGSGKSTLGLAIAQLLPGNGRVTAGTIAFDGTDLTSSTQAELRAFRGKRIGVVFQDPSASLNPVLTIGEQIAESIRLHHDTGESTSLLTETLRKYSGGLARRGRSWAMAVDMLARMGIPDPAGCARRFPHQLSGGMRQRAAIAMALSGEPDLLIADEPTTALDVTVQATILRELVELVREMNTSVLLVTHDLDVASYFCDRIAVLYSGQLFELASAKEIFENPQNPYTQRLLASQPNIDDESAELAVLEGDVPDPADELAGCRFAARCPEAIDLCRSTPPRLVTLPERLVTHDREHQCRCLLRDGTATAAAGGAGHQVLHARRPAGEDRR
ncbi:ABC transporter ATP-binding protein [Nonomuraea sp. K274]|uniref:ABC transporter ATP-binding protein n=1 Tax=Nonomuraea cypriaca TaxID=1187855 RepID=A0A931EU72_9ACTN|nr:ABC transporter ATP-binding protein [Nonomuraea cypriaca]MBF8184219.1 ABC transporter ATP-binding protein [Nonomuraea cypriaca]